MGFSFSSHCGTDKKNDFKWASYIIGECLKSFRSSKNLKLCHFIERFMAENLDTKVIKIFLTNLIMIRKSFILFDVS